MYTCIYSTNEALLNDVKVYGTTPIGLTRYLSKGGVSNGPSKKPLDSSLSIRLFTDFDLYAENRFPYMGA